MDTGKTIDRRDARRTLALVLAGGRGSRLRDLTNVRAKPAVHFGGKFRIIDFALSNCINSGMRSIGVITQYKSHSLLRHLQRGWSFLRKELNEFVELLPAQQRVDEEHWYQGTADAVYQNLDIIRDESRPPEYILILAGDHVYKMDYWVMLRDHVQSGRKVTVGCIEVPRRDAHAFGVMAIDDARHITQFVEKPADPPAMPGNPEMSLASMGIYIFNAPYLYQLLEEDARNADSSHDFGKDLIPARWPKARPRPTPSACRRSPRRPSRAPTGATWAPSTPTGPPTSTWPPPPRPSTCTTRTGRSGPTRNSWPRQVRA
jgi:glucose-1-phosphate adenylyltransferase